MEKEIKRQMDEIDKIPDSSEMFKAVGVLYRKQFQNTKVEDEGKLATSANNILQLTLESFKKKF